MSGIQPTESVAREVSGTLERLRHHYPEHGFVIVVAELEKRPSRQFVETDGICPAQLPDLLEGVLDMVRHGKPLDITEEE